MALADSTVQRERDKFEEVGGVTTVRTKTESTALPSDAATETKQDNIITELQEIEAGTDKIPASPSTSTKQDDIIELLDTYALQVAEDSGDSNVTYVGKAEAGSSTSAAVWQIQKIDETSGTVVQFEDGDTNFDNEWTERESGSYS